MNLSKQSVAILENEQSHVRPLDPTAPTDREWREWRDGQTLSGAEWARYTRN